MIGGSPITGSDVHGPIQASPRNPPGTSHQKLYDQLGAAYGHLKNPWKAFLRDLHDLMQIGAVEVRSGVDPEVHPRLDWPSLITEDLFFQHYRDEPRSGAALSTAV